MLSIDGEVQGAEQRDNMWYLKIVCSQKGTKTDNLIKPKYWCLSDEKYAKENGHEWWYTLVQFQNRIILSFRGFLTRFLCCPENQEPFIKAPMSGIWSASLYRDKHLYIWKKNKC